MSSSYSSTLCIHEKINCATCKVIQLAFAYSSASNNSGVTINLISDEEESVILNDNDSDIMNLVSEEEYDEKLDEDDTKSVDSRATVLDDSMIDTLIENTIVSSSSSSNSSLSILPDAHAPAPAPAPPQHLSFADPPDPLPMETILEILDKPSSLDIIAYYASNSYDEYMYYYHYYYSHYSNLYTHSTDGI